MPANTTTAIKIPYNINTADIVNAVSGETGMPKVTVKKILSSATQVVAGSLEQGNHVNIRGLGFFFIKEYHPRKIFNTRKKELIISAGTIKVRFKQSPTIKIRNSPDEEVKTQE